MDNTTSHYADCTIYTRPGPATAPDETVLHLDFKHLPHSKAKTLSMMGRSDYDATDSWTTIASRLVEELPYVVGNDQIQPQIDRNEEYVIEFAITRSNVAAVIDALKWQFKLFDISVSIFAGSLC
jgi:hypothetical protein